MSTKEKIVLHCCCAPCSCSIIEQLTHKNIEPLLFFYNPNIHPQEEYFLRKNEIVRYAKKQNLHVVDVDYDPDVWHDAIRGREADREGGERCSKCFFLRLRKTAEYASMNEIPLISSTLSISRRKNFDQVTSAGKAAASCFPNVTYWDYNWRKKGGSQRMNEIVKEEQFYRQTYCGCCFSFRI